MLVAAKVDPEHPHRAAKFINTHPGVTHNYLRNHDFNLWFTLATEPGSPLGLDGTLDVIAEKTGAESIRQLPTLKLFKIRMDLEMEKGTEELATAGEAVEPRELDPIELSDDDVEVIRATQGPMPVIEEPYAPAAERLGVTQDEVLRRLESLRERDGRAASPRSSSTAAPASRPTAWACGACRRATSSTTAAGWPTSAASRTATSARPTPTGPTPSSRWPTGAPRRSATRSSTRSPTRPGSPSARTLYSSTEFKKIRMLYFTGAFREWERENSGT